MENERQLAGESNVGNGAPSFGCYLPGRAGVIFPDDTGILVRAGSRVSFQMHYSASGEEGTDRSSVGFVSYPKGVTPKNQILGAYFQKFPAFELDIPPNSRVEHDAYFPLQRPTRLLSFTPHMHRRGIGLVLEAILPSGRVLTLAAVDRYDFNWQVEYIFDDGVAPLLPAGTMLHAITVHDNTSANPRNPDPSRWVGYGQASIEEMAGSFISWVYLDDADYRGKQSNVAPRASARHSSRKRNKEMMPMGGAARGRATRQWRQLVGVTLAGAVLGLSHPAVVQGQRKVQHLRGQNVAPVYDGYELNADGTYSLWFGYYNRNHEEHVDVPIGPDNRFEPGPADRGQPTHFVPQWQKSAFRLVVPKEFGEQKLTWRLAVNGRSETVTATLDPRSMIDRQKTTIEGTVGENRAPTVSVDPPAQVIARTETATIAVTATDDGLPMNQRTKKAEGLTVRWRKYRGPQTGVVMFTPSTAQLSDGKSSTKVSFSQPGEYVVQAVVDDGSLLAGTYCCWVSQEVKITVI